MEGKRDDEEGIQLPRHRSWCVSTDAEFAAKVADVIGLYLNPPHNALVLSVDEKPSIQALERARGYVQTSSEVTTGVICGKTTQTKKRTDFQTFMNEIVAELDSMPGYAMATQEMQREGR